MQKLKNFVMILTSYACDKGCPYCIAKIDALPFKVDNLDLFERKIQELKEKGYIFKYFILSGNGEPSLYDYTTLERIKNIVDSSGIFLDKRIQTSGNLFIERSKYELFKDWIVEITRVSKDTNIDKKMLKYVNDYTDVYIFKKSRKRVNLVLLKDNIYRLKEDIDYFCGMHNVEIVALKILDTDGTNMWINEKAINYLDLSWLLETLIAFLGEPYEEYSNYLWTYKGKIITLFNNKNYMKDKSEKNFMWYGDTLL